MSRSSRTDRRGQTEPLVVLAGVLAVSVGLTIYAGAALTATEPTGTEGGVEPLADRALALSADDGVVDPAALVEPATLVDDDRTVSVALVANGTVARAGPEPPADADRASRPTTIRLGPGTLAAGRLEVAAW